MNTHTTHNPVRGAQHSEFRENHMKTQILQTHQRAAKFLMLCALFAGTIQGFAQPAAPPATPSISASQAEFVYNSSGTYADLSNVNYFESWGGWSSAQFYAADGTNLLQYLGVAYGGIDFNAEYDVSLYNTLHIDLYTPNGSSFAVRLVSNSGQADVTYTTAGGIILRNTWIHLDIPLSQFSGLDLTTIHQIGLIDNNPGETSGADYYLDNVYFHASTTPLTVAITSPANGATEGPNYSVSATAAVSPNTISSVSFYDNGNNIGAAYAYPYTLAVTGSATGAHALTAVAQDSGGNYATSSIVNVTVGLPNLVLFQNGDFDHPSGPAAGCDGSGNFWATNSFGAPFSFSFPTSGGNPGGYAVMDDTGGGSYGVLVGGNVTPIPLDTLALVAGQTYTFQQDMILLNGSSSIGGLKLESWGPSGKISDSGNLYPTLIGDGTTWQTYTFPYTIDPAATGLKIVPLWGPNSAVGYDNIGVQVPTTALSVAITSPTNHATVNTNFTVTATVTISPASVTNVYFYVDNVLVGNNPNYPYTYTSRNASLTGSHTLKATAKASNGTSATSSVVTVLVVPSAPIVPNYPITDAPTPARQASSVLALLNSSGVYADQPVTTWATSWSVPSGLGVNYTNPVTGHVVKEYSTLQYAGVDFGPLDLSSYTVVHVDVWSPNAGQFAIKMGSDVVSFTNGTTSSTLSSKTWVSLDIPLSSFPSQPMSSLGEFLFVDNTPLVENATFYVDNVYFWTTNQVNASIALGNQVSWISSSAYNYQPQKSSNNSTWLNFGSLVTDPTVTNSFDPAPVPFYRVQQFTQNLVVNGGFEAAGSVGWSSIANGAASNTESTNAAHSGTWGMDFNVTGAPAQAGLQQGFIPITGGANYYFSAWSKLLKTGNISFGAFSLIQWFDSGNNFLSQNQVNLTGAVGTWTQSSGSFVAPGNATQAQILVVANDGAVSGDFGEVYIDDVALFAGGAPGTNIVSANVNTGVGVSWKSVPGNNYTVESSADLSSPAWSPLGANLSGNGTGTNTVSDTLNNAGKFYRVLENY